MTRPGPVNATFDSAGADLAAEPPAVIEADEGSEAASAVQRSAPAGVVVRRARSALVASPLRDQRRSPGRPVRRRSLLGAFVTAWAVRQRHRSSAFEAEAAIRMVVLMGGPSRAWTLR